MNKIIKAAVFILLFLSQFAYSQSDSRYDAGLNLPFNEKAGDVNPQTGNIVLSFTDVSLPGRAGHNFVFGRTWALNQSNVFAMKRSQYDGLNYLSSDTIEQYNHLGVGWNANLPYIFTDASTGVRSIFFGGSVYELTNPIINNVNESNIAGYDLKDIRVYTGTDGSAISYTDFGAIPSGHSITDLTDDRSVYVLILKDNSKYYFRPDGRLMMHQDRTGVNRIWYFYNEYETGRHRLVLVVDSIGREIEFAYDNGNISQIRWEVNVGKKTGEVRTYATEERSVIYSYVNADTTWPDIASRTVTDRITPYALSSVTIPYSGTENHVMKYDYETGLASFSFNSAVSISMNVFLMLTSITDKYRVDGYRSKRCFEYSMPPREEDRYSHKFWLGHMEYYKISREFVVDRHGRVMNDTSYVYYKPGWSGDFNHYTAVTRRGGVTATYTYSLSANKSQDNVLDRLKVETTDGFLQETDSSYWPERTKKSDAVFRNGQWVYSELYWYDVKGNLVKKTDRRELTTSWTYDAIYSIPTSETKLVTVDGVVKQYKSTNTIDAFGRITDQYTDVTMGGAVQTVRVAHMVYDSYGNAIEQHNADNNIVHTVFDETHDAFPVKTWQEVTIDKWSAGPIADHWKESPDTTETVLIRNWKVFNTDGTVWMEVDNEGYAIEHYYDFYGAEIETVNPNENDVAAAMIGTNPDDIYSDYLQLSMASYFAPRANNPGVRVTIDYKTDISKTYADIDKAAGHVKVTGKQGNGLGQVEKEIEYEAGESEYSVKEMTYDALSRIISLTDPDAGTSFIEMTVHDTVVNKRDKTWIVKYDDMGRKKRVIYPETTPGKIPVKEMTYDDYANTVTTKDPEGRTITEKMDWSGNLVSLSHFGDSKTPATEKQVYTYLYDKLNRKIRFTDPLNLVTKYTYDERNLLVKQDYGNGYDLMEYNALGKLVKKTDRKGQVLGFEYDKMGRNTKLRHYKSQSDFANSVIDHTVATIYDFRGNAVRIDNQSLIEYYVYDYANRVTDLKRRLKTQATRETVATVWGGDQATQEFVFSYDYNDAGLVTTMTYPDGSEHNFEYDGVLGRLENIMDGTTDFVSGFEYFISGVVKRMDYHNDTYQEWEFDNRKRISHIKVTGSSDVIEDLRYTINGSGDILAINDNEYDYDGFDRITCAKTFIPGSEDKGKLVAASFGTANGIGPIEVEGQVRGYNLKADLNSDGRVDGADHAQASFINAEDVYDIESFEYDKNGNRKKLVQNGDVYEHEYGERNQLVKVWKTKKGETEKKIFAEYEYDANGNTTERTIHSGATPQVIVFEYDTLNRLVKTTEGADMREYFYDNAGNRFIKVDDSGTTLYLRHQIAVAMDVEVNAVQATDKGKVNRYMLSGDLLAGRVTKTVHVGGGETVTKSYYHLDHLNSTKVVTDETGTVEVRYVYRAFGEQLRRLDAEGANTDDKAKYSYGGKELDDDTNLYYFNARYYDATIGRFINVDPIQDGSNWYSYCNDNPLSMKDPTGLGDAYFSAAPYYLVPIHNGSVYPQYHVIKPYSTITSESNLVIIAILTSVKASADLKKCLLKDRQELVVDLISLAFSSIDLFNNSLLGVEMLNKARRAGGSRYSRVSNFQQYNSIIGDLESIGGFVGDMFSSSKNKGYMEIKEMNERIAKLALTALNSGDSISFSLSIAYVQRKVEGLNHMLTPMHNHPFEWLVGSPHFYTATLTANITDNDGNTMSVAFPPVEIDINNLEQFCSNEGIQCDRN